MKRIIVHIPINFGHWGHAGKEGYGGTDGKFDGKWVNMYFWEVAMDLTDLPENTFGKLVVDFKDDRYHQELKEGRKKPQIGKIVVRLAYQPTDGKWYIFVVADMGPPGIASAPVTFVSFPWWIY